MSIFSAIQAIAMRATKKRLDRKKEKNRDLLLESPGQKQDSGDEIPHEPEK